MWRAHRLTIWFPLQLLQASTAASAYDRDSEEQLSRRVTCVCADVGRVQCSSNVTQYKAEGQVALTPGGDGPACPAGYMALRHTDIEIQTDRHTDTHTHIQIQTDIDSDTHSHSLTRWNAYDQHQLDAKIISTGNQTCKCIIIASADQLQQRIHNAAAGLHCQLRHSRV